MLVDSRPVVVAPSRQTACTGAYAIWVLIRPCLLLRNLRMIHL